MKTSNVIDFSQLKVARREQSLKQLVELTDAILQSAENSDWIKAVDLQRQRRQQLELFFSETAVPDEAGAVAAAIQYMLDIDSRVTTIVYSQREQLIDSASQSNKANQAARAYLTHME